MGAKTVSQLHKPGYADYSVAEADIRKAVGDVSKEDIWSRQVLVGVYVRPNTVVGKEGKITWIPTSAQEEDIWQGKALLVLKMGPGAFKGDKSYLEATFPRGPDGELNLPKEGDWLFARPNDGVAMSIMGEGAARPQGVDHQGKPVDKFEWDGWPCRILQDDSFFGKMSVPHAIV